METRQRIQACMGRVRSIHMVPKASWPWHVRARYGWETTRPSHICQVECNRAWWTFNVSCSPKSIRNTSICSKSGNNYAEKGLLGIWRSILATCPLSSYLDFWRSLRNKKSGHNKIKFGPRDLVATLKQVQITSIWTWKGCLELKIFVVNAIHVQWTALQLCRTIWFFLTLISWMEVARKAAVIAKLGTLNIVLVKNIRHFVALLDWIVEKPLKAAISKSTGSEEASFVSMQRIDRHNKIKQRRKTSVTFHNCARVGPYASMPGCSRCKSRQ